MQKLRSPPPRAPTQAGLSRSSAGGAASALADEAAAKDAERAHLVAYTELLQARCEELQKGGGPAAADAGAAEIRMLRGRSKALEEEAAALRVQLRDALKEKQRSDHEVASLRTELAQARLAASSTAAAAATLDVASGAGGVAGVEVIASLQEKITELTWHSASVRASARRCVSSATAAALSRRFRPSSARRRPTCRGWWQSARS